MFLKFTVDRSHLVSTGPEGSEWAPRDVLINTSQIVTATLRNESRNRHSLIIVTTDGSTHAFPCTGETIRAWNWLCLSEVFRYSEEPVGGER